MVKYIALVLIVVPALEIWGMLSMGKLIGGWQTFALILLTGIVGAYLAKREASKVWNEARNQMSMGNIPADSIVDGICIFAGGLLLMSPGFFTDIFGFLLVFPLTRPFFRVIVGAFIRKKVAGGQFQFFFRK